LVPRRARRIVSIFEPWAQIIRKRKLDRPTEFGMLVKVQEAEGGIVTDIAVDEARADAGLLVPSVELHQKVFGGQLRRSRPTAASTPGAASVAWSRWVSDIRSFPDRGTALEIGSRTSVGDGSSAVAHGVPVAKPACRA
jgi:hypothetical protein